MTNTSRFFSAVVLVLAASFLVTPAYASITAQTECEADGGDWAGNGGSMTTGTCTYPAGSAGFVAAGCNAETDAYVTEGWIIDVSQGFGACVATPTEIERPASTEDGEGSTTLQLGGGKNGSTSFPAGSCPQQCTISPNLPAGANDSLPGDAIATIYIRVVDEGGTPGTGSYTVCFENPDGASLTIYRYVGGVWTAVQLAATNPICVSASGDGAFDLGS